MAVRVPSSEAEVAADWLLERFPSGLEERDFPDASELAVFTDEAGEAAVRRKFPSAFSESVPPGWEARWREFHRPVRAAGVWIGPPWIDAPAGEAVVVVDPGRAFGTGAHPTTRACIELLSRLDRGSLLDAGCGSGVVAVAAARLGFEPLYAVDLDETAAEVAASTARANGVAVSVSRADVLRDELPSVQVVVANIELRIVEGLLSRAAASVAVTSGYPASEAPGASGWRHDARLEIEGWAADVLVAK